MAAGSLNPNAGTPGWEMPRPSGEGVPAAYGAGGDSSRSGLNLGAGGLNAVAHVRLPCPASEAEGAGGSAREEPAGPRRGCHRSPCVSAGPAAVGECRWEFLCQGERLRAGYGDPRLGMEILGWGAIRGWKGRWCIRAFRQVGNGRVKPLGGPLSSSLPAFGNCECGPIPSSTPGCRSPAI